MNLKQTSRMEYKKFNYLDREIIWIPSNMMLIEGDPLLAQALDAFGAEESIAKLSAGLEGQDKERLQQILELLKEIDWENREYEQKIEEFRSERSLCSLELNVAYACNLRCRYCFADDGCYGKSGLMSMEVARKAIDFLFANVKESEEKVFIAFLGGEPILNQEVVAFAQQYAARKAKDHGKQVVFSLTSNGTLLDQRTVDSLSDYETFIMLSLDSHDKQINDYLRPMQGSASTYDKVKANGWSSILSLKGRKAIRMTITPRNLRFFDSARAYYEAGFTHVHVEEVKSEKEEFQFTKADHTILKEEYLKLMEYLYQLITSGKYQISCKPLLNNMQSLYDRRPNFSKCGILASSISVAYDQKLYPCDGLMWDDYKLGDLENGVDPAIVRQLHKTLLKNEACHSCWARYLCGGVCALEYIQAKKKGDSLDCELELFKYELQLLLYYRLIQDCPEYFEQIESGFKNA